MNFVIFILERLIKGGNRGESEPLQSSTQFAVCHCLNSSWVWGYERACWKNKDFTRTFQNNIKVRFILTLKMKINAYSVSCCDLRKYTVLK